MISPAAIESEDFAAATTWPSTPSPDSALPVQRSLGDCELLEVLGRGGMGVVFKARQRSLDRIVAVKSLDDALPADSEQAARLCAEAQTLASLQHPNIVPIYGVGEQSGRPFFIMEFLDGGSLDRRLTGTPWPGRQAAELTEILARAVHVAHQHGIIHRDLKPANVLLTSAGVPKVSDFGLAKRLVLPSGSGPTRTGAILGTPGYMAPEQASGVTKQIGPAADIYALGAILYEMLTGRPPFRAETPFDTIVQILSQEPVPPLRLNAAVPLDLDTICLKCLEKNPRRRYATALDLALDLRRYLAGEPIRARPACLVERGLKWARRKPATAGLVTVSIAASLALVFGGAWHLRRLAAEVEQTRREARRADDNLHDATDVVNRMVTWVAQDDLLEVPHLEQVRRKLLEDALAFHERFLRGNAHQPGMCNRVAAAHVELADVQRHLHRTAAAEASYQQAMALLEPATIDDAEAGSDTEVLARCRYHYGILLADADRLLPAEKMLNDARRTYESLAASYPGRTDFEAHLAKVHNSLGLLAAKQNRFEGAREEYAQALERLERLLKRVPDELEYCRQRAGCLQNLAASVQRLGDCQGALEMLNKARDVHLGLPDELRLHSGCRWEWGSLNNNRGVLLAALDRTAEAEEAYRTASDALETLSADFPTVPKYRERLASSHDNWGLLLAATGHSELAESHWQCGIETREFLVREFPDNSAYRNDLAAGRTFLGIALADRGSLSQAEFHLDVARREREDLAKRHPDVARFQSELAVTQESLAELLIRQLRFTDARLQLEAAVAAQESAVRMAPHDEKFVLLLERHRRQLARLESEAGTLNSDAEAISPPTPRRWNHD